MNAGKEKFVDENFDENFISHRSVGKKGRKHKLVLKEFENHFIMLTMTTVVTGIILASGITAVVIWFMNPLFLGGTSLTETLGLSTIGLALMVGVYFYLLQLSHQIAGPVFVLLRKLDDLGNGDLTASMSLRKKDRLKEVAETLNKNVEKLNVKISGLKQIASELSNHASDNDETRALTEKLTQELATLKTSE